METMVSEAMDALIDDGRYEARVAKRICPRMR